MAAPFVSITDFLIPADYVNKYLNLMDFNAVNVATQYVVNQYAIISSQQPYTAFDWSPVLERAIRWLIYGEVGTQGLPMGFSGPPVVPSADPQYGGVTVPTLYFPAGCYYISRPIILANLTSYNDTYQPFSLELRGPSPANANSDNFFNFDLSACIISGIPSLGSNGQYTLPTSSPPAIIIQGATSVRICNLVITGLNDWLDSSANPVTLPNSKG